MSNFALEIKDNIERKTISQWIYRQHKDDYDPNDNWIIIEDIAVYGRMADGCNEGYPKPILFEDYILKLLNSNEVLIEGIEFSNDDELLMTFYLQEGCQNSIKFHFRYDDFTKKWQENSDKRFPSLGEKIWCTSKEHSGIIKNPYAITKQVKHILWQDYTALIHSVKMNEATGRLHLHSYSLEETKKQLRV